MEEGYTKAPAGTPRRPTGAKPTPKERLEKAPKFERMVAVPEAYWRFPQRLSYWYNHQYGCCVLTGEAFARAAAGIFITDPVFMDFARKHNLLDGAFLDEVLDLCSQEGFKQDGNEYRSGKKATVDFHNQPLLNAALALAPVKIGVASGQFQDTVGGRNGWFGVNWRPDHNTDHDVELCGYGKIGTLAAALKVTVPSGINPNEPGLAVFTWDTIGILDVPSMVNVTDEAWTRTPNTVVIGNNPVNVDIVDTPDPEPPPPPPPPGHQNELHITTPLAVGTYLLGGSPGGLTPDQMDTARDFMAVLKSIVGEGMDTAANAEQLKAGFQAACERRGVVSKVPFYVLLMDVMALAAAVQTGNPEAIAAALAKLIADLGQKNPQPTGARTRGQK